MLYCWSMFWELLQQNLFNIIQTIFLFLGFALAAKSYKDDDRSRQVGHLLQLGENYQKIKGVLIEKPELASVFEKKSDPKKITPQEYNYISQIIMQMYTVYVATKLGQFDSFEGIENDIKEFLGFPLPALVWNQIKDFQDKGFVVYVEKLLKT